MARKSFVKILNILFFSILLFSCKSTDKISENNVPEQTENSDVNEVENQDAKISYHTASYLNELLGKWKSPKGEYEYPFIVDGKRYLRYAWKETDDTFIWESYASKNSMELADLWKKRYAYAPYVYNENLPISDKNGTELGLKLFMKNNRIYSRKEFLISESVLIVNLNYFSMRDDGKSFVESGSFNFASDKFSPIKSDFTEYVKIGDAYL